MKRWSLFTVLFRHRLVSLWIVSLLLSLPGSGTVVPHLDVVALAERADLIVVGRVTNRERGRRTRLPASEGSIAGWRMRALLDVDKVIKGKLQKSFVAFAFILPDEGIGYTSIAVGRYGVFFLREAGDVHEVLDPHHAYVPAVPGALTHPGTPLDKITCELAHVVVSPSPPARDRWTRWDAVQALETILSRSATAALRTAAEDKDPLVRVWAISALLSRNDISMLPHVEKLGAIPPDPHVENLTARLRSSIERITDPQAIPALARLVQSKDPNVRRGAISALRNIGGGEVVKPLKDALEHSDDEVLWMAILGLAEITGDLDHGPGAQEEFKGKQKKEYVEYWRDWAKSMRKETPPENPSNK